MAAANFPSPILTFTLKEEGGFSDDSRDPGGATMHGITLNTFRRMMNSYRLTIADLKAITPEQETDIYRAGFWSAMHGDDLPSGIDLMVFDFGVNSGPETSIQILQNLLHVHVDGDCGPVTLAAAHKVRADDFIQQMKIEQMRYYMRLHEYALYGKGWTDRTNRRAIAAGVLASKPNTKVTP